MPPIYFAFPDGVFDYVCAECDALCCRGQGFGGSLRREMGTLLTLYPSLHSMAIRRRGDVVHFATFRQGCQFLDEDRLCRIERNHGKALKPGVCNLFPFNSFSRIGTVLVVSPKFICPLRIRVPAAPGAVAGTHSDIESAIVESQLIDEQTWRQTVEPVRLVDHANAPAVLEREAQFRDRCRDAFGRITFSTLLATTSSNPEWHDRDSELRFVGSGHRSPAARRCVRRDRQRVAGGVPVVPAAAARPDGRIDSARARDWRAPPPRISRCCQDATDAAVGVHPSVDDGAGPQAAGADTAARVDRPSEDASVREPGDDPGRPDARRRPVGGAVGVGGGRNGGDRVAGAVRSIGAVAGDGPSVSLERAVPDFATVRLKADTTCL